MVALACAGTASPGTGTAGVATPPGQTAGPAASGASESALASASTSQGSDATSPSPAVTPTPTPTPTPITKASLMFELDLEGPVIDSDAFQVNFSIDGADDVAGFCGFQASDLCSADEVYVQHIPEVTVGATIDYSFKRVTSTGQVEIRAESGVTFGLGLIIKVRCQYIAGGVGPSCQPVG
ncbi:MAG TPA: hypothetical protein VFO05_10430 [Candidatus Limnocylindrales bacterium]|nr:hypothetical protein [Candidatus Limnocylindrales bacterium]